MMNDNVVIRTEHLVKKYRMGRGELVALHDVSLAFGAASSPGWSVRADQVRRRC